MDIDEWFDIFMETLRKLGYRGQVDKDSFVEDWECDASPEKTAKEFFEEISGSN